MLGAAIQQWLVQADPLAHRLNALNPAIDFAPSHSSAGPAPFWAALRVALIYRWRHGRWPRLAQPMLFTEWVQWRKLNDRDRGLARLTDKLQSKRLAAAILGQTMVVPTLWHGDLLPAEPPAPLPLMVKANHGCGQFIVVRSLDDWRRARILAPGWLKSAYGIWLDEWHYGAAERTLLVEPYIGQGDVLPIDYKIYVFGGRAELVQVHEARAGSHRWAQYDRDWKQVSRQGSAIARPASLPDILAAAERLAVGREFLRVDFYDVGGRAMFGEFCLFPGSGLDRFDPPILDAQLGSKWELANGGRTRART